MLLRAPAQVRKLRRGTAPVELALLLPFLAFLFVIAIDYCRIFYDCIALENCARNGAYYASNSQSIYTFASVYDAVSADAGDLNPALNPSNVQVLYSSTAGGPYTSTTPIANGFVQVTVTWQFTSVTNFPGLPTTVDLSRSVEMQMCPTLPAWAH
jgi:Flp pilus assembly protein TadG